MKDKIKIPVAFQIRVDDVGWHKGDDDRWKNRPSRSGLPRMHHKLDYETLAKLGKDQVVSREVLMKICKALQCNIDDVCDFIAI